MHRARWMARAIYSLKIYLFRQQFKLTKFEQKALERIIKFILVIYVEAWFTAPTAISAPRQDLNLLKALRTYNDGGIKKAVMEKFVRHLDYLGQENVCLALFDQLVDNETKAKMAYQIMHRKDRLDCNKIENFNELHEFVSSESVKFFSTIHIDPDFLQEANPENWKKYESFNNALKLCESLSVVNDSAERAVALGQQYNTFATDKENQRQAVLTNVFNNRKQMKHLTKTEIIKNL